MASLLAPSAGQSSRISQVLPTVKCSNCNRPVPLSELGDHICAPQTVSAPSRPPRLASLAAGIPPQRTGTPPVRSPRSPPHERLPSPFERPPANTTSSGPSFQQRLSPLARNDTATSLQHPQNFQPPATSSLRPPLMNPYQSTDSRTRAASNASVRQPIPAIQTHLATPPPFAPSLGPPPGDIDTQTGGAAGMAGVGRRGFAAAARAAMIVAPSGHMMDTRPNLPRFLDMNVPARCKCFTPAKAFESSNLSTNAAPDTPPLSAGSGYSSHSPDPISPSPQTDFVPEALSRLQHPAFPPRQSPSPNFANIRKSPAEEFANGFGLSPLDRLPLLGNYMNQPPLSTSPESLFSFEQRKSPPREVLQNTGGDTMSSTYPNDRPLSRKDTQNSLKSATSNEMAKSLPPPPTSDSDSECGLAYADSTDDEDEVPQASSSRVSNTTINPESAATKSNHVHFAMPEANKSAPSRQSAASSYSLASGSETNDTMAKTLRSPPTSPSRLSRTLFGSGLRRSDSGSSDDSRSTYSRVTSMVPMMGPLSKGSMEQSMETLMEEAAPDASTADAAKESTSFGNLYFKEKDDSYVENKSHERDNGMATTSGQPHRSNTVQVPPHSPENKPPKLPTRAKTTNDSTKLPPRNEKARRVRTCLRCQIKVDDGRWIRVDTGGALCEMCWKNMYLPKVRINSFFAFRFV